MNNPYDLQRFVLAQDRVYENVLSELQAGSKKSHWMWFIFPQIKGLGHSDLARKFSIASLDEARAYMRHPVLAARLRECSRLVAETTVKSAEDIFGYPDYMKFHSSMTLFAHAAEDDRVFHDCLRKYFGGNEDLLTLAQMGREQ